MFVVRIGLVCLLAGCTPAGHPATVSEEEGHAAIEASMPATPPPPPQKNTNTGPFYQPDPNGYVSAILREDAPNVRYAAFDRDTCEAEARSRDIPFVRADEKQAPGVRAPSRLTGPLHGVTIRSNLPAAERAKSTIEIFDCRLLLALDDFTAMIAAPPHDVVEIIHLSAYRSRKDGGCTPRYDGKQHCAALAVDVASFKKKDGTTLVVDRDFKGKVGTKTCMPGVRRPDELWWFACEAAERAFFNVILTPNFNAQHKNHFHLEVTPDAYWMLIK